MSRNRLGAKLRQSPEYMALTKWLDNAGLRWELVKPNLTGHPALQIEIPAGGQALHYISSTPAGGIDVKMRISKLKRTLREHGYAC